VTAPSPRGRPTPPRQPVVGLLEHLTATSLDEDYAHVASRRAAPDATRGGRAAPARPGLVALVAVAVFGLLVATAGLETRRDADQSARSRESLVRQADAGKAALARRRAQAAVLQRQIATAQVDALAATARGQAARQKVAALGLAVGTVRTRGPGVEVRLDDAPKARSGKQQVQAPDLQKLVTALWLVGAEAIAINGYRVTNLTAIRDAAGAITVNYRSLRAPYVVDAIGDPKVIGGRLLDTTGYQTLLTLESTFGLRLAVDNKDSMVLPPAGTLTLRHARQAGATR
jgi:uncharacterized protein YlxW (UPF0749 family)